MAPSSQRLEPPENPGRFNLWPSLWWWQPLLGPGSREFWITPLWYLTIPFGLMMLFVLPFTFVGGFVRWLAWQCKARPQWPADVLAGVGPELDEDGKAQATPPRAIRRERIEPRW